MSIHRIHNITIVGSSHIAKESLQEVEKMVETENPTVVAVELDRSRLQALFSETKSGFSWKFLRRVGMKGFLFALVGGWLSRKLGKMVGVMPGSEMKLAVSLAKKRKATIALIDQHIEVTLQRISTTLTWREKGRFIIDLFSLPFIAKRKYRHLNLRKVPGEELIEQMLGEVKERYPSIYLTLIKERNQVLAHNLQKVRTDHPDGQILAVIGAGHVKGVLAILKQKNTPKTI